MEITNIYNFIEKVIKDNRLVKDRVAEFESWGFIVAKRPMGSGGVGQVKNGWRQISYGVGKWNYAYAVKL